MLYLLYNPHFLLFKANVVTNLNPLSSVNKSFKFFSNCIFSILKLQFRNEIIENINVMNTCATSMSVRFFCYFYILCSIFFVKTFFRFSGFTLEKDSSIYPFDTFRHFLKVCQCSKHILNEIR